METEQLQDILKSKSTTFVRKVFDDYCTKLELPKKNYKEKQNKWHYSDFSGRPRSRTICILNDGEHELNIALRKKAGYYFLIEYDRHRIFECEPEVIKLEKEKLDFVIEKYKDLFESLVS